MIIISEAGADREDQAAIRTNVVCNAVANVGVHIGNAEGQHLVAGFRPDGPVPIVTALGARPRSHASVSVADMTLPREWRRSEERRVGKECVSKYRFQWSP